MASIPWDEKYRPKNVSEFLFQNESHKALVEKFIREKNIPHLLLAGHHGTGKTSLALLLREELGIDEIDFLVLNGSVERGIDTVRDKIKNFISTYSSSEFKIVFIDEADALTPDAQKSLRAMMQTYIENARFIFACNAVNKITEPLRSRCTELTFKSMSFDEMALRATKILKKEKVQMGDEEYALLGEIIEAGYPDFRKVIASMQNSVFNGKLVRNDEGITNGIGDIGLTILEYMESDDWDKIREFACANVGEDQWDDLYRFLYTNLGAAGKFEADASKWKTGIVCISDHLYRDSFVADHEINFAACVIKLSLI